MINGLVVYHLAPVESGFTLHSADSDDQCGGDYGAIPGWKWSQELFADAALVSYFAGILGSRSFRTMPFTFSEDPS